MSTLAEIQDALADQIRTAVAAVTDVDVQVEPRMVLNPTPPSIDMYPSDPSMDPELAAMGDLVGGELVTVRARVSTADRDSGQDLLLALMDDQDPLSVLAAIHDDTTLGGVAATLDVRGRSGYVLFPDPGGEGSLVGCLWYVVIVKAES